MELIKRGSLDEFSVDPRKNNKDELYYKIIVKKWEDITETNESGKPIKPLEEGFPIGFTNLFLLQHSEVVPELMLKSEEEYRFYRELKRTSSSVDIDESKADHSFKYGDISYFFQSGEILAVKDNKIVQKCTISDFSRKPANTFRLLKYATDNAI